MIFTIVGARPQFIKSAPMSLALKENGLQETIIHTGQHYDQNMSDVFFSELGIPKPTYNLQISGTNHGKQTGRMLEAIESILIKEKPTYVLVYGDTNSTLAGALAASKLHIPVIHIEAGLRCFNPKMPEEINRVLTDHMSTILFSPSKNSSKNLRKEGISENKIYEVGDIMYDSVLLFEKGSQQNSYILDLLNLKGTKYFLATIHRAENTDSDTNLINIFENLNKLAKDITCIFPLHPRTKKTLLKLNINTSNIKFIDPVGYIDMLQLTRNADFVVTDSGGLQKEAFFLKTPCITLRAETEWVELVELGHNKLIDPQNISYKSLMKAIDSFSEFPKEADNVYGSGNTARTICKILTDTYQ